MCLCWHLTVDKHGKKAHDTKQVDEKNDRHQSHTHQQRSVNKWMNVCMHGDDRTRYILIEFQLLIIVSVCIRQQYTTSYSTDNDHLLFNLISDLKFKVLWHVWHTNTMPACPAGMPTGHQVYWTHISCRNQSEMRQTERKRAFWLRLEMFA